MGHSPTLQRWMNCKCRLNRDYILLERVDSSPFDTNTLYHLHSIAACSRFPHCLPHIPTYNLLVSLRLLIHRTASLDWCHFRNCFWIHYCCYCPMLQLVLLAPTTTLLSEANCKERRSLLLLKQRLFQLMRNFLTISFSWLLEQLWLICWRCRLQKAIRKRVRCVFGVVAIDRSICLRIYSVARYK